MSFFQQFFMWLGIIACILPCLLLIGGVIWLVGATIGELFRSSKYPLDNIEQIRWVVDLFTKYGFEDNGYINLGSDTPGVKMKNKAGNKAHILNTGENTILIRFVDLSVSLSMPQKIFIGSYSKYFILESLLKAMYGDSKK